MKFVSLSFGKMCSVILYHLLYKFIYNRLGLFYCQHLQKIQSTKNV